MEVWESITDKNFRDTFADQFQEVLRARNRFLYLQKLRQDVPETEIAPLRKELEADFVKAVGQFGQYLAPQVISMIERSKGEYSTSSFFCSTIFWRRHGRPNSCVFRWGRGTASYYRRSVQ